MNPITIEALWVGPHFFDIVLNGELRMGSVTEVTYEGSRHDASLQAGTNFVAQDRDDYICPLRLYTIEAASEWLVYRFLAKGWNSGGKLLDRPWNAPFGPVYNQGAKRFELAQRGDL